MMAITTSNSTNVKAEDFMSGHRINSFTTVIPSSQGLGKFSVRAIDQFTSKQLLNSDKNEISVSLLCALQVKV